MLHLNLDLVTLVSLMRSDRWLKYYMQPQRTISPLELTRIADLALADQLYYQPYPQRKEDRRAAFEHLQLDFSQNNWLDLGYLQKLKTHFLHWQGNYMEVKPQVLHSWSALIAKVDPVWLLASAYADLIQNHNITPKQLASLSSSQCPSALPKAFSGKEYADNHVHMGGHGNHALSLYDCSIYQIKNNPKNPVAWPELPEFTLFRSGACNFNNLPSLLGCQMYYLAGEIFALLAHDDQDNWPTWEMPDLWQRKFHQIMPLIQQQTLSDSPAQALLLLSFDSCINISHRWLLLTTALIWQDRYNNPSCQWQYCLRAYINACHILRSGIISSGVGLGNFVEHFSFSIRRGLSQQLDYKQHALQSDSGKHVFREFKVSPDIVKKNKLGQLAIYLHKHQRENNCHLAIHFSRSLKHPHSGIHNEYQSKRHDLLKNVRRLQKCMFSTDLQHTELSSLGLYDNETLTPLPVTADLFNLVRGIDVAGNENDTPIEVFAPAIRVLRASQKGTDSPLYNHRRQMHLTIHAGEDYSHLVCGLRSIDETVTFCAYQQGDRLGHALALGVDVKLWAQRQQRIYLTAGKHLDNLVWCHAQAIKIIKTNSFFYAAIPLLEQKIASWSTYIYDEPFSPTMLYQAWLLRRNWPNDMLGDELSMWQPDHHFIKNTKNQKIVDLWRRHVGDEQFAEQTPKLHKVVIVHLSHSKYIEEESLSTTQDKDTISPIELDLITAIQDMLIEEYATKQLILEVCPTSNIYIGRFDSYHEHPIFRWYPPKKEWLQNGQPFNKFGLRHGAINVCINTDDAGLMPTTIENEHQLLKESAIHDHSISSESAERWIDKIRQIGIDIFKSSHLNT